jgi:long-chain fatty acid transport protein
MRMIGFGASQVAMGGAAVALPLDAASVIVNPAGMSELGHRIDFGGSWFKPTVKYEASEIAQVPAPGFAVASNASLQSQRGASPVPALGMVLPVNDQFVFGLGAYGVSGMGVDYAGNLYNGMSGPAVTFTSYSQMRFAPGMSWKVSDQLSLGATLNVAWATMGFNVASGVGQVPHETSSSFGVGGTLGARYAPLEWFTVAAAYESRTKFEDFSFNVPARTALDLATGQQVSLPAGVDKLAFDQPQSVTVGFATNPWTPLMLAVDVQWINWSQTNGKNLPTYTTSVGAMPWNMNWSDQVVLKVGAQYKVLPMLALRAGYNYGKSPLDASRTFENIAFPAVAEHHITAGFGLNLSQKFSFNLAAMYVPEAKLSGSNPAQMIASSTTTMSQVAFDGNVAYQF